MPDSKKPQPPSPETSRSLDNIVKVAEREARELVDLGIGMFFDYVKQRLAQRRVSTEEPAPSASPYQVLGVEPGASTAEVTKAYRQRIHESHPDKGGSDDELRQVVEAWSQIRKERWL